jgi:anti-anti-sigma factor
MKFESHKMGTVDVRAPVGPLVDEDAQAFAEMLTVAVDSPHPRLVVSLDEVPYMDSVALEGLVTAAERMHEQNQQLKLASVTPTCREILELTGLACHFQIFEDVQDAVRSFM